MIGAGVRATPQSPSIRRCATRYPVLARAILAGASAQIRNMATVGGNLLQRTRCTYFYDDAGRAATSVSRARAATRSTASTAYHAILGASDACVADPSVGHVRRARRAGCGRAPRGS